MGVMAAGGASALTVRPEQLAAMEVCPPVFGRRSPEIMLDQIDEDWVEELAKEVVEKKSVLQKILRTGIPDYKKEELRKKAYDAVNSVHPDIANLRSVSLSYKFRMQAARNYQIAIDDLGADLKNEIDDLLYRIKNGIECNIW